MRFEIFHDAVEFHAGPLPVTRTMVSTCGTTIALVALAWYVRRDVRTHPVEAPGTPTILAEMLLGFVDRLVQEVVGRPVPHLVVFAGSLFLFLSAAALAGQLPGVVAPTANLVTTSALALLVFLSVPVAGIRAHGARGYLRHYLWPNPLLLPLHLVSEVSRTLALSLRLFGNMMSGHLLVALLVALAGLVVPMPLMALDAAIGLLQAYIFTVLTVVYVGAAIRVEEGT